MAAGKSTVGRILARRLGWELVDFDDRIRQRTGRAAGTIIREDGEVAFRELEAALTRELAGRGGVVLAPGGGWGANPALAASLGPGTVRVWLRVDPAEAVRRAEAEGADRPLLAGGADPVVRARTLLDERRAAYAGAEIAVDVDGREPEAVADEIVRRLERHTGGR